MKLAVENGSFAYKADQVIFENLSFELTDKTILAVLGKNGVGKTTMLKCIMGILPWRTGTLRVNGEDVGNAMKVKSIAYVPQAHHVTFAYTIRDLVTMGRTRFMGTLSVPSKSDYAHADEALEQVGLYELRHRSCNALSGGQLQMVYLARALAADPEILILDEPESHLDFKNQFTILELLQKLVEERNLSAIINTHYPEHALLLADQTMILGGSEYCIGSTPEIISEENIHRFLSVNAVVDTIYRRKKEVPVFAVTGIA